MSGKQWTLYVLKLEQGKYYVGITTQTPEARFWEHLHGRKAYWTAKYKPLGIIQKVPLGGLDEEASKQYENRVTRKYMKEKGINNVRGGDITTTNDLIARFGYYFDRDGWTTITGVVFMLIVIIILGVENYSLKH